MIDAVEVFPFVPVIPTVVRAREGNEKAAAANCPSTSRTFDTVMTDTDAGTPATGESTSSAHAPCAIASNAKRCPSKDSPRTQQNKSPEDTERESCVIPVIVVSALESVAEVSVRALNALALIGEIEYRDMTTQHL
jgi:hypothetical protein